MACIAENLPCAAGLVRAFSCRRRKRTLVGLQRGFNRRKCLIGCPGFENLQRFGFNDHCSSLVVARDRWKVCGDVRFSGLCVILRLGRYPLSASMRLNNRGSSLRAVDANVRIDDWRYATAPILVIAPNVPGAIFGAISGGIVGLQAGSCSEIHARRRGALCTPANRTNRVRKR